jgi:hypothetical protein
MVNGRCPTCGFIASSMAVKIEDKVKLYQMDAPKEQILLTARPDIYRNHPIALPSFLIITLFSSILAYRAGLDFAFLWCIPIFSSLVFIGLMLEPFATQLTVTNRRSILQQGILSNRTREVRHSDVRMLEVNQSLLQRMLKVGSVAVASAAVENIEIVINGIMNPQQVKQVIDEYRM